MKRSHLVISVLSLIFSNFALANEWKIINTEEELWVYEKDPSYTQVIRSIYTFKNGVKLSTNLHNFKMIDSIKTLDGNNFLVFSGRVCGDCDANTNIFVAPEHVGIFDRDNPRYSYPGKLYYYMDGSLIRESRAFYGECLKDKPPVVIWYSKYKDNDNAWESGTYHIELGNKDLKKLTNNIEYSNLKVTLELVNLKSCTEIKGREASSEP